MIQKFQKYFKLRQYDYLFTTSTNALVTLKRNYCILYYQRGNYNSTSIEAFIKEYINTCYNGAYILEATCSRSNYRFHSNVLLYNNQPVCYYDADNSTFVVVNTISSEIKDLLYKYIYISKSKSITYFQKTVEVDCLEYEEVYVNQNIDSFKLLNKVFYNNLALKELLNTNNNFFICDIPINNEDLLDKLISNYKNQIKTSTDRSNDYYNNFYGTVWDNEELVEDNEEDDEEDEYNEEDEEELTEADIENATY